MTDRTLALRRNDYKRVIGGAAALALGMGVGRFSYTLVLPTMSSAPGFSATAAAAIAAWNYFGYLIGAVLASHAALRRHRLRVLQLALIASILTSATMAICDLTWFWAIIRFLSGVSSAFIFIFASAIVLDDAPARSRTMWAGILYSGVGTGIFLSALYIQVFPADTTGFRIAWLCMAALSLQLFIVAALCLRSDASVATPTASRAPGGEKRRLNLISIAFFFEAVGYVIPATFIVHFVSQSPALHAYARTVWALVGLCAAPSILVWGRAARNRSALFFAACAVLMQGFGVGVDLAFPTAAGALSLGATLGFTFVAVTSLVIRAACEISPQATTAIIARLTIAFGVGQIVGPPISAFAQSRVHTFNGSLLAALLAMLASLLFLSLAARRSRRVE